MRYVDGYRVSGFPRYHGDMAQEAIAEDLFGQSALWNAFHIVVVSERKISLELRMVANAGDRSIAIYLLFMSLYNTTPTAEDLDLIGRLLPKQYVWSKLGAHELGEIASPAPPADSGWKVARIHRRMQYIDLPSMLQSEDGLSAPAVGATPEGRAPFQLPPVSTDMPRRLPADPMSFQAELQFSRFCLPLLGQMEEFSSDRRPLFEELQACAPAIVSVALHPFLKTALEADRQVATRFRFPLEYLGGRLANSGFAQLDALRRVYDRYFLTDRHIGLVTARVAGRTAPEAVAVAHQVCSWLGGMRAFRVFTPQKSFRDLSQQFANPELEYPLSGDDLGWEDAKRRLQHDLNEEGILHAIESPATGPGQTQLLSPAKLDGPEWDARYEPFLIRLPHVYTLEEAAQMVRLPYALEAGLPGLETRMLPPFHPSAQRYDPITDADGRYLPPLPDRIRIGRVNPSSSLPAVPASDAGLHWHTIPVADVCKHTLIVGSTGSGKTVTTSFLVRELIRLEIPCLIVEPVKTEYYDNLLRLPELSSPGQLQRWRLEGTRDGNPAPDFLCFDPLRLQRGVSVARHASYLKSCFEAAFPMEAWQALFLENALLDYYTADKESGGCGLKLFTRGDSWDKQRTIEDREGRVFPSFRTFKNYFIDVFIERELSRPDPARAGMRVAPSVDRMEEFRQIFRRRFENLAGGPLGVAFDKADRWTRMEFKRRADGESTSAPQTAYFDYLLKRLTVVELDAVPDADQKALIMAFLMTFLFERRQVDDLLERERATPSKRAKRPVEHVLVVEEAHRLLTNPGVGRGRDNVGMDSKAKAVSLFVDMLAEVRALRQGLVIVEQIPTKLVPEAVKNTNLKIMLRLTSRDDRDYLGEAMSFNEEQKRFVNTLRAEHGNQVQFVAFDENVDQPVLLSLPLAAPEGSGGRPFDRYFSVQ